MIQALEVGHNHEAIPSSIKAYLRLLKLCLSLQNPIPVKYAARKIGLPVGEFNLPMWSQLLMKLHILIKH